MRKFISALLMAAITAGIFSGCSAVGTTGSAGGTNSQPKVALYCKPLDENSIALDTDTGIRYVNDQMLVTFRPDASYADIASVLQKIGGNVVGEIGYINKYQIEFDSPGSYSEINNLADAVAKENAVLSAEVNDVMSMADKTVDKSIWEDEDAYNQEYEIGITDGFKIEVLDNNTDKWNGPISTSTANWGIRAVKCPEAWETYYDKMIPMDIGVLEAGYIDDSTADVPFCEVISPNIIEGDYDGHGLAVSSVIGARMEGTDGICGVFPKARLHGTSLNSIAARKNYSDTYTLEVGFAELICAKESRVINCSFGFNEDITFAAEYGDVAARNYCDLCNAKYAEFFDLLLDKGYDFVVVKSSGNERDKDYIKLDPIDYDWAPSGYISAENLINAVKEYKKEDTSFDDEKFFKKYFSWIREMIYDERTVKDKYKVECFVGTRYGMITGIRDQRVRDRLLVVGANGVSTVDANNFYIAGYSNGADKFDDADGVDLTAPGSLVCFNENKGGKTTVNVDSGTSLAAPFVSGIAGMIYAINPDFDGAQVKEIIKSTTNKEYANVRMPDAKAALDKAAATLPQKIEYASETTTSKYKEEAERAIAEAENGRQQTEGTDRTTARTEPKITNADEVLATLRNTALMDSLTEAELDNSISEGNVPDFFVMDMNNDGKLEIYVMAGWDSGRPHSAHANYLITFSDSGSGGMPTVQKFSGDSYLGCNPESGVFANSYDAWGSRWAEIDRLNFDGTVDKISEIDFVNQDAAMADWLSDNPDGKPYSVIVDGKAEFFSNEEEAVDAFSSKMSLYGIQYADLGYPLKSENFEKAVNEGIRIAESIK